MKLILLIAISLLSCSNNVFYKTKEDEYIIWNENYELKWQDFKGLSVQSSNVSAISFVELRFKYKLNKNGEKLRKFDIMCSFSKSKSWVKDLTNAGLDHEQGHFDIGEIWARQFKKRLSEIKRNDSTVSVYKLRTLFREYSDSSKKMQEKYDEETNCSQFLSAQRLWKEKIKNELDFYQAFKK